MATLLGEFQVVAPPSVAAEEILLPLTFLDIIWLPFHPIRRLLFYEFPCSKHYFIDTIVPKLKTSLSLALKHYYPLAGRILYPHKSDNKPVIRYLPQDSVTFSAFESDKDFDLLVGNSPRDSDLFYDLIPQMPPTTEESDYKVLHLLAVQVTLFEGRGICIGVANHHSAGDATSIIGFLKSWASISKLGGDEKLWIKQGETPPVFDRSLVRDSGDVASVILSQVKQFPPDFGETKFPTRRVRATYVFRQSDIKKLKDLILSRNPGFLSLSSFVVTTAYIWTCLAKSLIQDSGEEIADEAEQYFLFAADCRSRIDPPLPATYFGNCVAYGLAKLPRIKLVGEEGFFAAADGIAVEIKDRVNNKEMILKGSEKWIPELLEAAQKGCLSVAGSSKVDLYGLDFGWGGARKTESPSIDQDEYSFSLCRDSVGGLEVGLSLPAAKMALFAAIFAAGRED